MTNYPPPRHAGMIWEENGQLVLRLDNGADPGGPAHTVRIAIDELGLRSLAVILRERKRNARHTIGTPGAPTQQQVTALRRKAIGSAISVDELALILLES
jgi:hypothetical protein